MAQTIDVNSTLDNTIWRLAMTRTKMQLYAEFGVDIPETLSEQAADLEGEVKEMVRDELKRKLRVAQARFETLKTADQKRADLGAEIAKLKEKLG